MPKKILLVDDDPDILEALATILEVEAYQTVRASDGIECMAALRAENPDLIILDLLMPKMDGFAVLKELQEEKWTQFKKTPILILSSIREGAAQRRWELETALEFDVDDYIEKPIEPELLLKRVAGLLVKQK